MLALPSPRCISDAWPDVSNRHPEEQGGEQPYALREEERQGGEQKHADGPLDSATASPPGKPRCACDTGGREQYSRDQDPHRLRV